MMGQKQNGKIFKTPQSVRNYQNTIIEKICIECGNKFLDRRSLKAICYNGCRKKRKLRFRPQTFKICLFCNKEFGPVDRLSKMFCSYFCKKESMKTGITKIRKTIRKARNAQSLLRYYIQKGKIIRPKKCEHCNCIGKKIEGAHINYDEPLNVKWLCRSCHIKFDKKNPKNVTYAVKL